VFLLTGRNPKIILVSWNKIALPTFGPKIVVVGGSAERLRIVLAQPLVFASRHGCWRDAGSQVVSGLDLSHISHIRGQAEDLGSLHQGRIKPYQGA
jgi:hypothetical protein